jgi:hypothetical protein
VCVCVGCVVLPLHDGAQNVQPLAAPKLPARIGASDTWHPPPPPPAPNHTHTYTHTQTLRALSRSHSSWVRSHTSAQRTR